MKQNIVNTKCVNNKMEHERPIFFFFTFGYNLGEMKFVFFF